MEDLRKLVLPPNEKSVGVVRRKCYDAKPWAVKYLGRRLNATCLAKFKDANIKGFKVELPWEEQEKYVSHNAYDDSTFIHELVVSVHKDGPAAGRISDIDAHHWEYWHTSSNWQDHSENHVWEKRCPNESEIQSYERILDSWTEGGSAEQIESLVQCIVNQIQNSNGALRAYITDDGYSMHLSFLSVRKQSFTIALPLHQLQKVLDLSHLYPEVLISGESRSARMETDVNDWEGIEYVLPLFKMCEFPELYPNLYESLEAWLYDIFLSCERYRAFMGSNTAVWWRDAWWKLQEMMSIKEKREENIFWFNDLLDRNGYKPDEVKNPLLDCVSKIGMPDLMQPRQFEVDLGVSISHYLCGKNHMPEFKKAVVNGVEWSYCHPLSDRHIVINLSDSNPIDDSTSDCVVIPSRIEGYVVGEIRSLGEASPKPWKHVEISKAEARTKYEFTSITIGKGAFRGWQQLETIICHPRVLRIEDNAFEDCISLKTMVFEDQISIGSVGIFRGCTRLSDVGMLKIGSRACVGEDCFKGCAKLLHVDMLCDNVISFGESAFEGCKCLERLTINPTRKLADSMDCVGRIKSRCFCECSMLTEVLIPENIKIIESNAFSGCASLHVVQSEGDDFWFRGHNCTGNAEIVFWNGSVQYGNSSKMPLSKLLDTLGIERSKYLALISTYKYLTIRERLDKLQRVREEEMESIGGVRAVE